MAELLIQQENETTASLFHFKENQKVPATRFASLNKSDCAAMIAR